MIDRAAVRCKFCRSPEVIKNGLRKNTQYWLCKSCGHGFVDNQALPKMKYPADLVIQAVSDYYNGASLYKICREMEQTSGVSPAGSAVYQWVRKFAETGLNKVKNIRPQVGDTWITAVIPIWLDGEKLWHLNLLDLDTQFLFATRIIVNRSKKDIKKIFEEAKEKAGENPKWILAGSWKGYGDAIEQVFGAETSHIVSHPFRCRELSIDYIKYWHDTLKTKLKFIVCRDVNGKIAINESIQPILDGFVFYYNFFRPLRSASNKTPAEQAGINFPCRDWRDLLKNKELLLIKKRQSNLRPGTASMSRPSTFPA
jgi:transposase-like protein